MFTLKLTTYSDEEITDLINRLNVINPENTVRCAVHSCEKCNIKHVCYAISHAVEYAQAYLDGRLEK